jgi:hypothetical protein
MQRSSRTLSFDCIALRPRQRLSMFASHWSCWLNSSSSSRQQWHRFDLHSASCRLNIAAKRIRRCENCIAESSRQLRWRSVRRPADLEWLTTTEVAQCSALRTFSQPIVSPKQQPQLVSTNRLASRPRPAGACLPACQRASNETIKKIRNSFFRSHNRSRGAYVASKSNALDVLCFFTKTIFKFLSLRVASPSPPPSTII